ncbi:MAG: HD domain-containing protein [Desulfobacteraceae bacterium]|jgi:HD superfamily phosphodiesterase
MRAIFDEIWRRAKPYLNTRKNDIHTEISVRFAEMLLKKEGGDENVVMPAIILHDVGWIKVPKDEQHKGFGPEIQSPSVVKKHELEGVEMAKRILEAVDYDKEKVAEILEIIEGHDSRKEADSINESIVKDADKLWRFSREGFTIDCDRFNLKPMERVKKKDLDIDSIFFTDSAKQIARKEIQERLKESKSS